MEKVGLIEVRVDDWTLSDG